MSIASIPCAATLGELVHDLGGIPADRVRLHPYPGAATEADANSFVIPRILGFVIQPDALTRMLPANVREPDVSFTRTSRLPNPLPQIGGWCPDLCVDVLSPNNTSADMLNKRQEYFGSGCQLGCEFDVEARTNKVDTKPAASRELTQTDTLDGGGVLAGFTLPLADLFRTFDDGLRPLPSP